MTTQNLTTNTHDYCARMGKPDSYKRTSFICQVKSSISTLTSLALVGLVNASNENTSLPRQGIDNSHKEVDSAYP